MMPSSWVLEVTDKAVQRLGRKYLWKLIQAIRNLPPPVESVALREALRTLGIFISDRSYADFCASYGELNIDVDSLIGEIFSLLSPRRRYVVDLVIKKIDPDRSGLISLETIDQEYDTMRHPHVLNNMRDPDTVKKSFTNIFESLREQNEDTKSAHLTVEQLMGYYLGISLTTSQDNDFELRCIRSFSLDRPRIILSSNDIKREIFSSRAESRISRLLGQSSSHPLYTTTNSEYGNKTPTASQITLPKHTISHKFTKNIPCHSYGATSMNM